MKKTDGETQRKREVRREGIRPSYARRKEGEISTVEQ